MTRQFEVEGVLAPVPQGVGPDFRESQSSPRAPFAGLLAPALTLPCPPQHMREAAERRQQLELEHEQALAVLHAKQQEIDLLQKVSRGCAWGRGVEGKGGGSCAPASPHFPRVCAT